jgi:chromosome segregation ATPase
MSNDKMTTAPTIDTLLARLDEWGTRFTNELSEIRGSQEDLRKGQEALHKGQEELRKGQEELRKGQEELRKGQEELRKGYQDLRSDLTTGLRRIERKIEILNDNLLTVNADIRDLEVRMEKLESASLVKG